MSTSKLQNATKERLMILLNGYEIIENYRPDWLKNPLTKRNLEIDIYIPSVKIGIEVQGKQHFGFVPMFHQSEDDFEGQKQRDAMKRFYCKEQGVTLYEVITLADIDVFIEEMSDQSEAMSWELYKKQSAIKSLGYYAAKLHGMRHMSKSVISDFAQQILHITEKYNIPPESVRPDFTITKLDMSFLGNPIVRIDVYRNWSVGKFNKKGALIGVENGIAHVKTIVPNGGQFDFYFDLNNDGDNIKETPSFWRLDLSSLPERYKVK